LPTRRVIVGFSGGVTSAWCAGWALRHFPRDEVVLLFHDTKAEDADTYRFLNEMAARLQMPITDRSDGRSLDQVFEDHNAIANNRMGFCSEELKQIPGKKFIRELQEHGVTEIVRVFGFSANEGHRIQRQSAYSWQLSTLWCEVSARFPIAEEKVTKQDCANWCSCTMGVSIPRIYEWSEHANCVGCIKGGKNYWLAVKENAPEVYAHRKEQEQRYGCHLLNGFVSLTELETSGVKRVVGHREPIEELPCECGG